MIDIFSYAHAESPAAASGGGGWEQLILIAVFIAVFYFFLIRPQQKRAKAHKKLLSELNKGDEVITSGGIYGRILKVGSDHIVLETGKQQQLVVQKSAISTNLPKGTLENI